MSLQLNKIKKRIKSVNGAYKVTSAMKLISTARLSKFKNRMLANREYSAVIDNITRLVLSSAKKANSPLLKRNDSDKNLYIIISSTLGLCGSYNTNVFKVANANIKENDEAIILGKKGLTYYQNHQFKRIDNFSSYSNITNQAIIKQLVNFVQNAYIAGDYKEVHIIYTEYKNSLIFMAKDSLLLPLEDKKGKEEAFPPILEPTSEILVERLTPLYTQTVIYSKLLESEVCEQAARRNAMENATDNAEELLEDLQIQFNKARQTAITQEITEIVSAANVI